MELDVFLSPARDIARVQIHITRCASACTRQCVLRCVSLSVVVCVAVCDRLRTRILECHCQGARDRAGTLAGLQFRTAAYSICALSLAPPKQK